MNNNNNKDRPQMADADANDSQALKGGDITLYRAFVARISCLSQDRPDLKFADMQVLSAMAKPSWSVSRGSEDTSLGSRGQSAGSAGSRVVS